MSIQITIRKVPRRVRDKLASRAASQGQSMQEFLLRELVRIAERPSIDRWMEQVRERKALAPKRIPPEEIVRHREADRR